MPRALVGQDCPPAVVPALPSPSRCGVRHARSGAALAVGSAAIRSAAAGAISSIASGVLPLPGAIARRVGLGDVGGTLRDAAPGRLGMEW